MSKFFNWVILVMLIIMSSKEVTSRNEEGDPDDDPYVEFGCHRNIDALCSTPTPDHNHQTLTWAIRYHKHTRDYKCKSGSDPQCCAKGKFKRINDISTGSIVADWGETDSCAHGGQ
ncbi:hypothetical protein Pst134EA_007695 [Puccinia striiformis f. sp. tritici]|uniref:hypothetical protein n=1 Tax=Puccinia striiformis f. sp. tritici TaxID=168172 RepID=UPI0020078586|nr:hypothetical protein Pst134EA_007695 [Puccinia striiformis f. sp. tritici]KAH9470438.1 hypothetical protein Pst134EA_007695 [Puccinia striiformis f. sp. tritici]